MARAGIEDRIQRYRAGQSRRDRQRRQQTKPKQEKEKPEMPDYFSHYNGTERIQPFDIERYTSIRMLCSRENNIPTALYLTSVLAQNPELQKEPTPAYRCRQAIIEQSNAFMEKREIMLCGFEKEGYKGRITVCKDFKEISDIKSWKDLIIIYFDGLMDIYDSLPGQIFEECLREKYKTGDNPKSLEKVTRALARKMDSEIAIKIDEIFIEAARESFENIYRMIGDENKYREQMEFLKGFLPWKLAFADSPENYIKARLRLEMIDVNRHFKDILPEVIKRYHDNDPAMFLRSKLSQKGCLIAVTRERDIHRFIKTSKGDWIPNPYYDEKKDENRKTYGTEKKADYERVMGILGVHFGHIATFEHGKEKYVVFSPKSL